MLNIKYPKSGEDVAVGNFIKPSDSAEEPEVTFIAPDENAHYTLLMVDPDAPSKENPIKSPYRHWVVANVPGTSNFSQSSVLSSYMGPAPPPKTKDHRYIFLLYKQPNLNSSFSTLSQDTSCWDFKSFVKENDLELVGVNFFISKNDDN